MVLLFCGTGLVFEDKRLLSRSEGSSHDFRELTLGRNLWDDVRENLGDGRDTMGSDGSCRYQTHPAVARLKAENPGLERYGPLFSLPIGIYLLIHALHSVMLSFKLAEPGNHQGQPEGAGTKSTQPLSVTLQPCIPRPRRRNPYDSWISPFLSLFLHLYPRLPLDLRPSCALHCGRNVEGSAWVQKTLVKVRSPRTKYNT
jgi:hypothetical protein